MLAVGRLSEFKYPYKIFFLKGMLVHAKTKIMSFPHPHVVPNQVSFFSWAQKKIFWRMLVTKELTVAIDLHIYIYQLWPNAKTLI